jgi:1,4-dihydroxy-2-naphthoate polyprenyltransferase
MVYKSSVQLLRFHFSVCLLPIFLFGLARVGFSQINWPNSILLFFILHVLVYPSSNGYNSYMDKDTTSVGGIENPLQPTKQLYNIVNAMDFLAVCLSFFLGLKVGFGVLLYILFSRAYSYRGIRLKQYPVIAFLVVAFFQGAVIYWLAVTANKMYFTRIDGVLAFAAACLISSFYPISQIYQHVADKKDNVTSLSMLLGYKGTFIFSGLIFFIATVSLSYCWWQLQQMVYFYVFNIVMLPALLYFLYWAILVFKNSNAANYKHTMRLNFLAAICNNLTFLIILFYQYLGKNS